MGSLHQIQIELDGIAHVLSDKMLVVPAFQRSYAWEEAHITDLFQDVSTALADKEKEYFLGSIVVTGEAQERLQVVDGQQRLATTIILLAAIRDHFLTRGDGERATDIEHEFLTTRDLRTQERSPRLRLNDNDNDYFLKRVLARPEDSVRKTTTAVRDSHQRIDSAAALAAAHVERVAAMDKKPIERLAELVEYLKVNARVILIRVPDDANAFVIFETLNDRGLELAISDLLKNYLFLAAENRITEVQQQWIAMVATLEAIGEDSIVVDFIRHLWSSKYGSTREKELYSAMKGRIGGKQAAVDFAAELAEGARLYAAMLNPEHELWSGYSEGAKGYMAALNLLQMIQIRPLLLAVLSHFSPPEVEKALRVMLAWGVRLLVVGGLGSGTLERHYAEKAKEIRSGNLKSALDLATAMTGVVPTDAVFEHAFATGSVSKAVLARYYLSSLEQYAKGKKEPELIPNPNQNVVNLEHVLPQTPSGAWAILPEDAKAYYKRIGNLALMGVRSNSKIGNDSFAEKVKVYANSSFDLTKKIAEKSSWGPHEIEERQLELAKYAVKTWPITV